MTQQQDSVGLREICSGGRPPRGFLENLETLCIKRCASMSCLFPSWMLIQSLRKLKEVNIRWCGELEDVFQLEGLSYAKENPFLLSSLESLHLDWFRKSEVYMEGSHPASLEQELAFPSLKVLDLDGLKKLECLCKGPTHLLSLPKLKELSLWRCDRLRHMFSPSLARNFMQLEKLIIDDCGKLEQIFIEDDAAEYNQTLSKDHLQCQGLTHLFSSTTLVRNLLRLESIDIEACRELEQIIVEDHTEDDHVQLGLFPNLSSISINGCGKLKSMFPVNIAHFLSLQNLTTLKLYYCHGLTHLFSSTLARNLLQLESIDIWQCRELEQIIVEDHPEDDQVQLGLFPNLSSISIKGCGKLKTLFPAVTTARSGLQKLDHTEDDHVQLGLFPNLSSISVTDCDKLKTLFPFNITQLGLQKLKTLNVVSSSQLEELFEHKDEADTTSDREMVLPQLENLTLQQLASLVNFCPIGYHFIFPSSSELLVTKCPKLTTRFSINQNRPVHAEAKVLTNVDVVVDKR
ncbi:hypothetical protein LWI29_036979 [Acer saccharum]|uniref:Disease resistance protein At4g27190-like leucine-rich repeats domain-containing protein n=1 Tax=Acer saccharum TaxID=4024 RepID=A0AA39TBS8_ACESA|nr:hypothetical protein LWI29_036979 [Acer saccharum]